MIVLPTSLGNRAAFSHAFAEGLGVTEAAPRSQAAAELRALLWAEDEAAGVVSMAEARQRLTDYIQQQQLESGNSVRLNPQLSHLLPSLPAAAAAAAAVPKAVLFKAFGVMPEPAVTKRSLPPPTGSTNSPAGCSRCTRVPGRASRTRWLLTRPSGTALTVIEMSRSARGPWVSEYARH